MKPPCPPEHLPADAVAAEYPVTGVDGRELRLRVWLAGRPHAPDAGTASSGTRGAAHPPGDDADSAHGQPSSGHEPPLPASVARNATRTAAAPPLPALLLLDGQYLLQTIPDSLAGLGKGAPLLVASLGFASSERPVIAPWRARDYTPAAPGAQQCDPRNAAWPCGGADTLLEVLKGQVLPLLQARHGADLTRTALFGHSYAGLFALHTWLTAPNLFCHIYAASPSLWWYWPHLRERLGSTHAPAAMPPAVPDPDTACPAHSDRQTPPPGHASGRPGPLGTPGGSETSAVTNMSDTPPLSIRPPLHILVGADEQWRPLPAEPGLPRPDGIPTAPLAKDFITRLRQHHPLAQARLDILPDLAHGPMLHASAARCLRDFQGALASLR